MPTHQEVIEQIISERDQARALAQRLLAQIEAFLRLPLGDGAPQRLRNEAAAASVQIAAWQGEKEGR